MYIAMSKGKGFTSWLTRKVTTFALRRMDMRERDIHPVKAFFGVWLSTFGIGKTAKIQAQYNHTFLVYKSVDFNKWFTVDIQADGVEILPIRKTLRKSQGLRLFRADFDLKSGVRTSLYHIDRKYDWKGLLGGFAALTYLTVTGKIPRSIWHSKDRDLCTEYVTTVINKSKGATYLGKPELMYPDLLASTLEASSEIHHIPSYEVTDILEIPVVLTKLV